VTRVVNQNTLIKRWRITTRLFFSIFLLVSISFNILIFIFKIQICILLQTI